MATETKFKITKIKCDECGKMIVGNSPKHAEANMLAHKLLSTKFQHKKK